MSEQKVAPAKPAIPVDSFQDFKAIHMTTTELLRHFWLAHPSSRPQDQAKCNRIVATMKQVRDRIVNWRADAERNALDASAVAPCQQMAESLLSNVDKVLAVGAQ